MDKTKIPATKFAGLKFVKWNKNIMKLIADRAVDLQDTCLKYNFTFTGVGISFFGIYIGFLKTNLTNNPD